MNIAFLPTSIASRIHSNDAIEGRKKKGRHYCSAAKIAPHCPPTSVTAGYPSPFIQGRQCGPPPPCWICLRKWHLTRPSLIYLVEEKEETSASEIFARKRLNCASTSTSPSSAALEADRPAGRELILELRGRTHGGGKGGRRAERGISKTFIPREIDRPSSFPPSVPADRCYGLGKSPLNGRYRVQVGTLT